MSANLMSAAHSFLSRNEARHNVLAKNRRCCRNGVRILRRHEPGICLLGNTVCSNETIIQTLCNFTHVRTLTVDNNTVDVLVRIRLIDGINHICRLKKLVRSHRCAGGKANL